MNFVVVWSVCIKKDWMYIHSILYGLHQINIGGGWVRQKCRVSCLTRASNWYWGIVGQGLLPLQQVRIEGECFYFFCFFSFIHFPLSSLSLSFISSTISSISLLSFSERQHKMTHKGWRVVKPQHNKKNPIKQLSLKHLLNTQILIILCCCMGSWGLLF